MAVPARTIPADPHIPVLLRPLLAAVAPVAGIWLDGTFGAGGYARGLLEAGADPSDRGGPRPVGVRDGANPGPGTMATG